ncbi:DUF4124 domain-containing protein [Pseudomonas frederiksbergensis]|uniref:DUF4124 domain-containing protein n=1 Tax=Pseudomonas frederiksbergensis TaxID=104087 RepID=UPI000F469B6A|nr:DUF4124 domain-containing protein [Pseudomonas frederiksbergensis]RON42964.1 hypothetical protein BK667_30650 [Pseudomonas frederiksbergensis]
MKWTLYLALAALCITIVQAADVYKCTTSDGRVIFSNSGCGTASGSAELQELKINNMGQPIKPSSFGQPKTQGADRDSPHNSPTVVRDSANENTADAHIKRRLRAQEEYLDSLKPKIPGVTVIKDEGSETNHEKSMRLRDEAQELYYQH